MYGIYLFGVQQTVLESDFFILSSSLNISVLH